MSTFPSIIVFSKTPESPNAKTRLRKYLDNSFVQELHKEMVRNTLELIKKCSCDQLFIYWDTKHSDSNSTLTSFIQKTQSGEDFGERFEHSIKTTFLESQSNGIIIIGTDCPLLSTDIIEEAIKVTTTGTPVIGPAQNGGFYLLGIPRSSAECNFSKCFGESIESLEVATLLGKNIYRLPFLFDIDEYQDLVNLCILHSINKEPSLKSYKEILDRISIEKDVKTKEQKLIISERICP